MSVSFISMTKRETSTSDYHHGVEELGLHHHLKKLGDGDSTNSCRSSSDCCTASVANISDGNGCHFRRTSTLPSSSAQQAPNVNARRSRTREVASRYKAVNSAAQAQTHRYQSPTSANNNGGGSFATRSPSPNLGRSPFLTCSSATAPTHIQDSFSSSSSGAAASSLTQRPLSAERCRRRPFAAEPTSKATSTAIAMNHHHRRPSSLTKKRPSVSFLRSETATLWPSANPTNPSLSFNAIAPHHDVGSVSAGHGGAQHMGRRFSPQRRASSRVRMSTAILTTSDYHQRANETGALRASTCTMVTSMAAADNGGGFSCNSKTETPSLSAGWWPVLPSCTALTGDHNDTIEGTITTATTSSRRRASDGQRSENGNRAASHRATLSNCGISSLEETRPSSPSDAVDDSMDHDYSTTRTSSNHPCSPPMSQLRCAEVEGEDNPRSLLVMPEGGGSNVDEDGCCFSDDSESISSGKSIKSLPSSSDAYGSRAKTTSFLLRTTTTAFTSSSSAAASVPVKTRGTVVPARFWQESVSTTTARTPASSSSSRTVTPLRGPPPCSFILNTSSLSAPQSPASPSHHHVKKGGGAAATRTQSPSKTTSFLPTLPPQLTSNASGVVAIGAAPQQQQPRIAASMSMSNMVNTSLDLGKAGSSRRSWGQLQQQQHQQEEAHELRMLSNRWWQWRFVNARAEHAMKSKTATAEKLLHKCFSTTCDLWMSVSHKRIQRKKAMQAMKLDGVLEGNAAQLREWESLHPGHSSALGGLVGALEAAVIKVPIIGTKIDIHATKEALCSAVGVMDALESFINEFSVKVETVGSFLSEVAETILLEKASLMECSHLLDVATLLETEESSLRAHLMQMEADKQHTELMEKKS